jgi:YidC/Oxa1 family membrane protein insertase
MVALFHIAIYQPLYNVIVFFYDVIPGHDFGIAIILTTLLLKAFFIPLSKKQIESQKKMQELQPKIKELQKRHKEDKEAQTKAIMALYKEHGANPVSGCLPLIIQLIFLIAIYRVIINISQSGFLISQENLYFFINNPGMVSHFFIGFIDLSKPNYIFAALAALAQYFQTKTLLQGQPTQQNAEANQSDIATIMNKQMLYLGPGLTFFIGVTFPAALSLYWLVSTVFMLVQQTFIIKRKEF